MLSEAEASQDKDASASLSVTGCLSVAIILKVPALMERDSAPVA